MNIAEYRPARKLLVLGIGNPDRGDDGVGVEIVGRIGKRLPPGSTTMIHRSDVLASIEEWANLDAMICVDGAEPRGCPGRIHRIKFMNERLPHNLLLLSSHGIGLAEALGLAEPLGLVPPKVIIYAIEGASFGAGRGLSEAVGAVVPEAVNFIIKEVKQLQPRLREVGSHARKRCRP